MKLKLVIILAVAAGVFSASIAVLKLMGFGSGSDDIKKPTTELAISFDAVAPQVAELTTKGHYDFHFQNIHDVPVTFGVLQKNCNCSSVEVCIAPDEWKALKNEELAKRVDDPSLKWEPMVLDGPGKKIPAGAAGWLRVNWPPNQEMGAKRYTADLWMQKPDRGAPLRLEVLVSFVPPVIIRESQTLEGDIYDVGKLDRGDTRTVNFMLFSHTRDHFEPTPAPTREDPCVVYGKPSTIEKEMLASMPGAPGMEGKPVKCGYFVPVTIHEHVGNRQFDLGAFRRTVAWKTDAAPDPIAAKIRGIVLGEVSLANPGKYPGINLETIHPDRPVEHAVTLDTDNPDVQLTLDKKSSVPFLDVKLTEDEEGKQAGDGHKYWTVSVKYMKDSGYLGQFPDPPRLDYKDCAVVFLVTHKGFQGKEPERRIRIPVRGTVQTVVREGSQK
jgi:hypothetical protein